MNNLRSFADELAAQVVQWRALQSSPSLAATSPSATDRSFNNDVPGSPSSSSLLSVLPDTDLPPTIDSFIPILKFLRGLYLDQNVYANRFGTTLLSFSKFILGDVWNKDSEGQISPAAFLRFARLQHPDMPLIPSLADIVIVGPDASLPYLELLVTPWLKSLEVLRISDSQQPTLFSFLTAIEQEAPLLQTIIFSSGRFPSSSLQLISKFNNLRHFELKHEGSEIPFTFFDDATMIRMVATACTIHRARCFTPISMCCTFNQLAKLHVVGWLLPLLKDLIPRTGIMSTTLQDVSIRLSDGELKKKRAEERRRGEWEQAIWEGGAVEEEVPTGGTAEVEFWLGVFSTYKKGENKNDRQEETASERQLREEIEKGKEEQKELQRMARIAYDVYTKPFAEILRTLCSRWRTSLKSVSVCQLDGSFQCLLKPPILPEEAWLEILLLPAIENFKGWTLDLVESVLDITKRRPNLKSLLLPLDETNSGISLDALRDVAETCPNLESFQCRIEPLTLIPEYTVPTTGALSRYEYYPLETLLRFLTQSSSISSPVTCTSCSLI
ncbi:hypothetical protein BYT27DRAFT_7244935 [Phlegmacium glaucopus]|nr:hypothetical protein BYT27DRAFT_7244935 [Phlegmacium glaucopus]